MTDLWNHLKYMDYWENAKCSLGRLAFNASLNESSIKLLTKGQQTGAKMNNSLPCLHPSAYEVITGYY